MKILNNIFKYVPSKPKVLITLITHRGIDPMAWECIRTVEKCPDYNIDVKVKYNDALICRSRSIVASRFMERDYDCLMFLDDDIVYDPMDAIKLIKFIVEGNLDIVGGAYVKRQKKDVIFAVRFGETEVPVKFGAVGSAYECDMVSTGFMAVSRRVFQSLIDNKSVVLCHPDDMRFYNFFMPFVKNIDGKNIYLSEDWAFCERARQQGFKIYCDTTSKLRHAGRYEYDWDDFFNPKKEIDNLLYREIKTGVEYEPIFNPQVQAEAV